MNQEEAKKKTGIKGNLYKNMTLYCVLETGTPTF
jgi:hypothetical protein